MACTNANAVVNGQTIDNPVCVTDASELIPRIITILLSAAAFIALAMLLWGAIQYITSSGDQVRVQKAKSTILYAIIGLVVSCVSLVIYIIVSNILGFSLF